MSHLILEKLNDFFTDCEVHEYRKGQIITHAREEPEGVLLLVDGLVEQYDITPEGNKVTVNIFKPTAFFPMSWAINGTPNMYFYAALSDVKLKKLTPVTRLLLYEITLMSFLTC